MRSNTLDDTSNYNKVESGTGININNWLSDVDISYEKEILNNSKICVKITVDVGDNRNEFKHNNIFNIGSYEERYDGCSSVIWLLKQQGYDEKKIDMLIDYNLYHGSRLLESVYRECKNLTTDTNVLAFFVSVTIDEWLKISEYMVDSNKNEVYAINLPMYTICGLINPCNWGGSMLDIELETDVKIPLKYIKSVEHENCGVNRIYCAMCSRLWDGGCAKIGKI